MVNRFEKKESVLVTLYELSDAVLGFMKEQFEFPFTNDMFVFLNDKPEIALFIGYKNRGDLPELFHKYEKFADYLKSHNLTENDVCLSPDECSRPIHLYQFHPNLANMILKDILGFEVGTIAMVNDQVLFQAKENTLHTLTKEECRQVYNKVISENFEQDFLYMCAEDALKKYLHGMDYEELDCAHQSMDELFEWNKGYKFAAKYGFYCEELFDRNSFHYAIKRIIEEYKELEPVIRSSDDAWEIAVKNIMTGFEPEVLLELSLDDDLTAQFLVDTFRKSGREDLIHYPGLDDLADELEEVFNIPMDYEHALLLVTKLEEMLKNKDPRTTYFTDKLDDMFFKNQYRNFRGFSPEYTEKLESGMKIVKQQLLKMEADTRPFEEILKDAETKVVSGIYKDLQMNREERE